MATLSTLLATWPKGLWESIIKAFYNGIPNYIWALIVFIIVLKLILFPLDYFQRAASTKTTRMQAYLKPELDKLQKRYGTNQKLLQEKQNELYKKHNFNMGGSCAVMFINLILTVVIFFTLYSGLGKIATFKIQDQYDQLEKRYDIAIAEENARIYEANYEGLGLAFDEALLQFNDDEKLQAQTYAQNEVAELYEKIKDSWLWVKNIWRSDTKQSAIPSFEEYTSAAKIKYKDIKEDGVVIKTAKEQKAEDKAKYNTVMAQVKKEYKGGNGLYILAVLAVLVNFLSQFLMRLSQRPPKEKREQMKQQGQKKGWQSYIMLALMPLMMLFFAMTSNAMFAVYIIINSLMASILTPLSTFIINKVEKARDKKEAEKIRVDYRR